MRNAALGFHSRSFFVAFAAAVFLIICAAPALADDDALVVQTTAGLLRGATRSSGGAQFLGVPYAEPPVGPLRWRAPLPKKRWTGIRDANAFGSSCAQPLLAGAWNRHDAEIGQEDCLYLNVVLPAWPASKPLPVMFWIHGGANEGGSGSGGLYNEGTLTQHGVILVTINYRLGILGFFAHPNLTRESMHQASGNYGLMDQILALRWVRDNIARFGGDPNNITVFGQSAGAMDTGILMTSPLARGLFHKAIAESGSPLYPVPMRLDQAEQAGKEFTSFFTISSTQDPIDFLRQVPAQDLIAKASKIEWGHALVGPDIDGWVVPRSPAEVFKTAKQAPIPLLLGTTSREFGSSEPIDQLRKTIADAAGKYTPQALALYSIDNGGQGVNDPIYGTAANQWAADWEFHCPITTQALWHSARHNPVFMYEFDYAIPGQEAQGALHSAELPYVFGYFPASGNISGNFGPIDTRLADLMQTYWTNFAKTGDPNDRGPQEAIFASRGGTGNGLPHWPEFDDAQHYLTFTQDGQPVATTTPLRGPQCDLYRKTLPQQMKQQH